MSGIWGALLVLGLTACASTAGGSGASAVGADTGAIDGPGTILFAANQGEATVSVIDADRMQVIQTVRLQDLGFSVNAKPHHIVAEPDGSFWYLSLIGENRVLKFNSDHELVDQAEFEVPGMLALHPTDDVLLVGRSMSAVNPPTRVGRISRSTMEAEEVDVFFPRPHALAIAPGNRRFFSASLAVNQVASVDLDSESSELYEIGGPTYTLVQFAVAPDGQTMVATAQLTGELLVFDIADPAAPRLIQNVSVGEQPWHPVFTPDGRFVVFGNKQSNSVSFVDTGSWKQVAEVRHEAISEPHGSAVSPDGRTVYISSNNMGGGYGGAGSGGTVVAIDVATMEVRAVVETGANTTGLALSTR